MDEHERTVRAARQVDVRIGFYIHLWVFLLVCAGLVVVNWLTTPQIWWAQWPFLGWGIAVLGHALCAFGSGPNFISQWRLRKIRALTHPEAAAANRRSGRAVRTIGMLVLGILIGSGGLGGYMYRVLQDTRDRTRNVEASRDALDRSFKEQEARLRQLSTDKTALEGTVKETKDQLSQVQSSKQAAEQALRKASDELAEARSAREAAERALAEAKKGAAQ